MVIRVFFGAFVHVFDVFTWSLAGAAAVSMIETTAAVAAAAAAGLALGIAVVGGSV